MLFNSVLVSSVLLTSAVLADRRIENYQSGLLNRGEQSTNAASNNITYDTDWAGAFLDKDNGTFTGVTGTFTAPHPKGQINSTALVWVALDSKSCPNAYFQAGIAFTVTDKGPSYAAYYEWYPDDSVVFSNLSISAGDDIRISVSAHSATSGIAKVENLSNNQSAHRNVHTSHRLCGQNAAWIVESFEGIGIPFPNFGNVTFMHANATGPAVNYTPDVATILEIRQNNKTLTDVSIDRSSVTIKYE